MATLSLYLLTFNCARTIIQPNAFASHLFDALPHPQPAPDILVISLEEVAPISHAFLGGSFLTPYFNAFRQAVKQASDATYVNTITRNLGMTAIMVFVRENMVDQISWLQTAGVGVGVQEMGNKGAIGARMGLKAADEDIELTFVAAHLAPMEDGLQRRNDDWRSIVEGLVFTSEVKKAYIRDERDEDAPLLQGALKDGSTSTGMYTPNTYLFFGGDLNYRTSELKPHPEDVENFPQPTKDISDPRHFSHLLEHDQLTAQLQAKNALHGLTEAPINFPPTYKYADEPHQPVQGEDVTQWNWATHRWPSWCDRILYLDLPPWMSSDAQIQIHRYKALPLFSTSDHRPVALSLTIPRMPIPSPENSVEDIRLQPPFALDTNWQARRSAARRQELVVGVMAYLSLTWEGRGLTAATLVGVVGGWLIIRSLLVT